MKLWSAVVCAGIVIATNAAATIPNPGPTRAVILGYDHPKQRLYFSLTPQDETEQIPDVYYYCFAESCGREAYPFGLDISERDDPEHYGDRVEEAIQELRRGLQWVPEAEADRFESRVVVSHSDSTMRNGTDRIARHLLDVSLRADSLAAGFQVTAYGHRRGRVEAWYEIPRLHYVAAIFSYATYLDEGADDAEWVVVLRPPTD